MAVAELLVLQHTSPTLSDSNHLTCFCSLRDLGSFPCESSLGWLIPFNGQEW